ncbi:hypothetical protein [Pseudonocardia sp.]|uniref:hypothetical protein n=1 Tax=Pseudonocardia sp. TaxID=60912 RepID=UPI003D0BD66A
MAVPKRRTSRAGGPASGRVPTATGHVLVVCGTGPCDDRMLAHTVDALSGVVRGGRHSILVRSGCTAGPVACLVRGRGPMVAVQPCDAHQRPAGPATRVGPLRSVADVDALVTWLRDGTGRLPDHLLAVQHTLNAATRN